MSCNNHTRMEQSVSSDSSSGGDSTGVGQTVLESRNSKQDEKQQAYPPPRGSREMKPKEMLQASRRRPVNLLPQSAIVQDTSSTASSSDGGADALEEDNHLDNSDEDEISSTEQLLQNSIQRPSANASQTKSTVQNGLSAAAINNNSFGGTASATETAKSNSSFEGAASMTETSQPSAPPQKTNDPTTTAKKPPSVALASRDAAGSRAVAADPLRDEVQPPYQKPTSFVESVEIYTGPLGADFDASALQSKDYFVRVGNAAAPVLSWNDKAMRPLKRKFDATSDCFVDPATIAYIPDAWSLDDSGNLLKRRRPCGMIHATAAKLVHPDATREEWLFENSVMPVSAAKGSTPTNPRSSASADARAQRSHNKLLGGGQKEKDRIPIGNEHQVFVGDYCPCAPSGDSKNRTDLGGGPDKMWDPQRAQEARERGEKIDEFLEKGEEFNVTMLLMKALHSSGYCVKTAMKEFIGLYNDNPNFSVTLNESQSMEFQNLCGSDLIGKEKNFKEAAERLGVSKESVIVNYYNWKKTHPREYKQQKDARNEDNVYCEVCDDGGTLLVCDHCHKAFHLECLTPPLETLPKHDWYCDKCIARSPAMLRRLSSQFGTPTQSPGRSTSEGSSVARRLQVGGTPSAALKAIFKDVKSRIGNAVRRPSGMDWDPSVGCWVRRQGAEEAESWEQTSHAMESDGEEELAAADDDDDVLEENDSDDDEYETSAGAEKKRAPSPPSPPSSVSSAHGDDSDSDFKEDDIEDDDEEEVLCNGGPTKMNPGQSLARALQARPPSPVKRELYGIVTPITPEGLLLTVINTSRGAAFGGYRPSHTGVHIWTAQNSKFRAVGDIFHEIDGVKCDGKSFPEITALLKQKYAGQTVKTLVMSHKLERSGGKKSSVTAKLSHQQKPPPLSNKPPSSNNGPWQQQQQQQQWRNGANSGGSQQASGAIRLHSHSTMSKQMPFQNQHQLPGSTTAAAAAAAPNKAMGVSLPQSRVAPMYPQQSAMPQPLNGGFNWQQTSQNMASGGLHFNSQQLAPRSAANHLQNPGAFVPAHPTAVSNVGNQRGPVVQGTSSLVDLTVPDLLQFLAKRGIMNPRAFLDMDVVTLAGDYAAEKGVDKQVALDFVCHARLYVRSHYHA